MDEWVGGVDSRNDHWQDIARVLRVRDLRVYKWPSAYNVAGGAKKQKRETLAQLKAAGYKVEAMTWHWNVEGYPSTFSGFLAKRNKEVLPALWASNGSPLFLYWGHQVPQTPARKRDDNLIEAAIDGEESRVETLLKQGADPQAIDYAGSSVLVLAAAHERAQIVRQLLAARKTQPAAPSKDITSALQFAVRANHSATVQAFLEAGVTSRQVGDALHTAAVSGTTEMAQMLAPLAAHADVDRALVAASWVEEWRGSQIQYPDIVRLLLGYKPSQGALDAALMTAAIGDEKLIVPALLAAGANIETRNAEGRTVLLLAAADGQMRDLSVRKLLEAGADPNVRDKEGNTALMWAVSGGVPADVKLFLARGVDPHTRNNKGKSALDWIQSLIKTSRNPETKRYLEISQLLQAAADQSPKR